MGKYKSTVLVFAQFLCIGALLPGIRFAKFSELTFFCLLISFSLLSWALIAMSANKLKVFPEPDQNASLITTGPYKFIRHPMYTSVLFGSAGLVSMNLSWISAVVFLILLLVLIVKLLFEENLLIKKFDNYRQYCHSTFRLIPFVY